MNQYIHREFRTLLYTVQLFMILSDSCIITKLTSVPFNIRIMNGIFIYIKSLKICLFFKINFFNICYSSKVIPVCLDSCYWKIFGKIREVCRLSQCWLFENNRTNLSFFVFHLFCNVFIHLVIFLIKVDFFFTIRFYIDDKKVRRDKTGSL